MSIRERVIVNRPSATARQLEISLMGEVYRGKRVPPDWDAGLPRWSQDAESGVIVRFPSNPSESTTQKPSRQFTRKISFAKK